MIGIVPEADSLELHMTANMRQVNGIWRIVEVRRHLHDLHEAVESSDALLIEPAKIDQLLHGVNQDADEEQVGHQVGQTQRGAHNRDAAKDDHGDGDELARTPMQPARKAASLL